MALLLGLVVVGLAIMGLVGLATIAISVAAIWIVGMAVLLVAGVVGNYFDNAWLGIAVGVVVVLGGLATIGTKRN